MFLCHLHHIFDTYEYIVVFKILEKTVFDLKIKHFPSPLYVAVGTSSFVVLEVFYNSFEIFIYIYIYCHIDDSQTIKFEEIRNNMLFINWYI